VISNVRSNPTSNDATITWTTNIASDSQVEYGPASAYGSSTPVNPSLVTTHSVTVTGLSRSATYHFRVRGADAAAMAACRATSRSRRRQPRAMHR
jgi:Purple acid Phosphatase, N-terminal domain